MLPQLFTNFAAACQNSGSFFGLVPWYGYLPASDFGSGCSITSFRVLPQGGSSDIPLVFLAVIDDLMRIAGLIAVGFVIYAAIQYITSQGDSNQTAKAQSTIINALVGLAITLIAVVFVSYLGKTLG